VPVATKDVFHTLGLRPGELLVGVTDVFKAPAWPAPGASIGDWAKVLERIPNDLEKPALKVQPVIGEVLAVLGTCTGALLARMSGSGATCFAVFGSDAEAQAAGKQIRADHPEWWVHAGALS
jgi:4-diphosphocytidyl-2-C-methyl-D-erythritol kinase